MTMRSKYLSRTDALLDGSPTYYTGEPCKFGHIATRGTASGECSECRRCKQRKKTEYEACDRWFGRYFLYRILEYYRYRYGAAKVTLPSVLVGPPKGGFLHRQERSS